MDCRCKIKHVLDAQEVAFIKHLFKCTGREEPPVQKLAILENMPQVERCEHIYSWGFSYYCSHPEIIDKFLSGNK